MVGATCVHEHVAEVLVKSSAIQHELESFDVVWGMACCLIKFARWIKELAVGALIAEGLNVVSIGVEYALAEAKGPVFVFGYGDAWKHRGIFFDDKWLGFDDPGFAEERGVFGGDLC